jgi:methylenetetrahydrofolate reductase (NADPH)
MPKITEHIASAKKTLFSFEILPPLKGESIRNIYDCIDPLMEFKPPFIDVTYHREEYVYRKMPNGLLEKKVVYKRPGTISICAAIMNKYKVDAVPHLLCGGFNKEETENALIEMQFLGIENVLVLRGDAIKSEGTFIPNKDGHAYASELLQQVMNMNKGIYIDDTLTISEPTNFCVGVAGYPEKHFEAPSLKSDLKYLKKKIDLGAEYIVTQMFFDNKKYFDFVDLCRKEGINVPIIPGLKPLSTKKQLTLLPSIFRIDIPDELVDMVEKAKDAEAVKQIGIEWCVMQSKELMKAGVPVLHYYTMSKSSAIKQIASQVF